MREDAKVASVGKMMHRLDDRRRRRGIIRPSAFVQYVLLSFYSVICLYPIVWIALTSFKDNKGIFSNPFGIPRHWLWSNYVNAWNVGKIGVPYLNSLIIAVLTVTLTLIVSTAAAYVVAKFPFRGSRSLFLLLAIGIFVPQQAVLLPLFLLLKQFQQINQPWTLVIVYVTYNLSVSFFVISGYLRSVPDELLEAAVVDGASFNQAFFRIVLPLLSPPLATAGTLIFLNSWNEFMFATLYTSVPSRQTLPVAMANFVSQYTTQYAYIAATVMLAMIPILLFFVFFQKQVIQGLTTGAVKG